MTSVFFRPGSCTMQIPPPPRLIDDGIVTVIVRARATAASAAVPPNFSTSSAAITALGSSPATAPKKTNPLSINVLRGLLRASDPGNQLEIKPDFPLESPSPPHPTSSAQARASVIT